MKYTFKCPACVHVLDVEANNDDSAVDKLMAAGGEHMKENHPDMPSDPNMPNMVREQMQKS